MTLAALAPEAGTVPTTEPAEIQGANVTTPAAGAVPDASPAEDGGTGDTTTPEAAQAEPGEETTANTDRGKHQTTLEERALQLAEKRFAEMQDKFEKTIQQKQEAETKPFVVVNMEKINEYLLGLKDAISDAELKGDISTALDLEDQLRELRASVKNNEKKRTEWEKARTEQQKVQTASEDKIRRIDESAEFYRQQKNIPQAAWDTAGKWLSEQFAADPILTRQFSEMVDRQGEMAALAWADKYCQDNMGAGAKADSDAKSQGKSGLITAGGTNGTATVITTWNGLMKLPGADIVKFEKENPAVFQKLKDAHFK